MKIWGNIPKVTGIYDKQKSVGKVNKAHSVTNKKDVVSISGEARDFQTVMNALRDVPDIRRNRVKDLTQRIESGNYNVTGKDVAEKILKSLMDKKI